MIFQNLIGPKKSRCDVPNGNTQGKDYPNEKQPLTMATKSYLTTICIIFCLFYLHHIKRFKMQVQHFVNMLRTLLTL